MRELQASIEVGTEPERVWAVLTDFPAYPDWNPFIRRIEGALEPGTRLEVRIEAPPGQKARTLRPRLLAVEPNRRAALARLAPDPRDRRRRARVPDRADRAGAQPVRPARALHRRPRPVRRQSARRRPHRLRAHEPRAQDPGGADRLMPQPLRLPPLMAWPRDDAKLDRVPRAHGGRGPRRARRPDARQRRSISRATGA